MMQAFSRLAKLSQHYTTKIRSHIMASPVVTGNVPTPGTIQVDPANAPTSATPVPAKQSLLQKPKNVLEHAVEFFDVAIKDISKYGPAAEVLAAAWIPQFKDMAKEDADKAIAAASLVSNTVVAVQQKYSDSDAGDETNADKLADALSLAGPAAVQLLQSAGVKDADTSFVANGVNATVAILKNYTVPATK